MTRSPVKPDEGEAWTPGPWRVFSMRSIRSTNPQHKGCEVAHTTYGWGDGRRMANARLIAAAPELYAVLEQFQKWLTKDAAPSYVGKEDMRVYQLEGGILSNLLNASREVLAKARGGA
jgi:hypothetical protein